MILLVTMAIFSAYSLIFYFILRTYIKYFKSIYLLLLIPDIILISVMVHYTGHLISSPFVVGYYLVGALFSFYYGLQIGLVAVIASIIAMIGIPFFPGHLDPTTFLDLIFKIGFLFILALGAGSLSEQNAFYLSARERLVSKLRALHDFNNRLMTKMDLNQRLGLIASEGAKILEAKTSIVLLYDNNQRLVPRAFHNANEEALQKLRSATKEEMELTFAGISARSGEIMLVDDIFKYKPKHPFRAELEKVGLKSVLCTPITYENKKLGVFCVYNDQPIQYREEELDIASTFAAQIALSIENSELVKRVIAKEEMGFRNELKMAKELQMRFLPKKPLAVRNLEIGLVYQPAKEVGGDFFDFFRVGDKLNLTIGDVVGKGTPAALIVSMMSYAFNALARFKISSQNILTEMNEVLRERTSSEFFVTMIYSEFDPSDRKLVIYNAGHVPPLHYDAKRKEFEFLKIKGLLLGIERKVSYPPAKLKLEPGDAIVFYTDGLVEARRPDQESIGLEGLKSLLKFYVDLPAQKLAEKLKEEGLFGSIEYLQDDCTILVLKGVQD